LLSRVQLEIWAFVTLTLPRALLSPHSAPLDIRTSL
jgi:hypothetical protein